jgi:hypothetical protein
MDGCDPAKSQVKKGKKKRKGSLSSLRESVPYKVHSEILQRLVRLLILLLILIPFNLSVTVALGCLSLRVSSSSLGMPPHSCPSNPEKKVKLSANNGRLSEKKKKRFPTAWIRSSCHQAVFHRAVNFDNTTSTDA